MFAEFIFSGSVVPFHSDSSDSTQIGTTNFKKMAKDRQIKCVRLLLFFFVAVPKASSKNQRDSSLILTLILCAMYHQMISWHCCCCCSCCCCCTCFTFFRHGFASFSAIIAYRRLDFRLQADRNLWIFFLYMRPLLLQFLYVYVSTFAVNTWLVRA